MNYLKMLGAVAIAVTVTMAFAATAVATTLTSPEGTTYTGKIKAESEGKLTLSGSFVTVEGEMELEGTVSSHGAGQTVKLPLSFLRWFNSNWIVRILSRGTLEWHGLGNGNGTITWSGLEMEVESSVGKCIFTTNSTDIGTFTWGTIPRFHFGPAKIPRTGGNFLCGSSGTLSGTLKLPVPHVLIVD